MKTRHIAAVVIALLAAVAVAQKPKTVDEAVQILKTRWLKPKDLDWVLRNPKDQVVWTLYRPFGTGVRNEFGLWGNNEPLRESCGDKDPEGCSVVIFNRLWESVRAEADPALVRQLDCQFQLLDVIHINYKGFNTYTTGDLLKSLQSQINGEMARLSASGTPPCQKSLEIDTAGKPDRSCFVDASLARDRSDKAKEAPLGKVLAWLSVRNFFETVHEPPRLTLSYTRQCQFRNPPPIP